MYGREATWKPDGSRGAIHTQERAALAVAGKVLPQGRARRADMEEGACGRVEPAACSVESLEASDADMIAGWPRWMRGLAYIVGGLTIVGVLPMALAAALSWALDTFDLWWIVPLAFAAGAVYGYRRLGI